MSKKIVATFHILGCGGGIWWFSVGGFQCWGGDGGAQHNSGADPELDPAQACCRLPTQELSPDWSHHFGLCPQASVPAWEQMFLTGVNGFFGMGVSQAKELDRSGERVVVQWQKHASDM